MYQTDPSASGSESEQNDSDNNLAENSSEQPSASISPMLSDRLAQWTNQFTNQERKWTPRASQNSKNIACYLRPGLAKEYDSYASELLTFFVEQERALYGKQGCSNYYGSNFLKAFRIYGEQDENNNSASDEISDVMCDGDDEDEDGVEVDFVAVTAVLDEDDGLQFQLPKHHRCACHILNLVSKVDAAKACSNEAYKKLCRSAFAKCHAVWNKCGRSAAAAEIIEDVCKIQLIRPNTTQQGGIPYFSPLRDCFESLKIREMGLSELSVLHSSCQC
ncbi:uncharacterized protein LOC131539242 [Onychostoma macrolepis]|uniref:uncharacterized protein LOC131539242 n=1 Tax=Onychostoma macrolepis TaxID=369639 RepID=UPI00272B17D7|nr:uncharacterized protein LOC131539242 [Onychostoma macrolepis]